MPPGPSASQWDSPQGPIPRIEPASGGGLITTFPENPGPDEARWQLGGVFETQLGSDVVDFQGDRFELAGPSFTLQQHNAMTQYVFFRPRGALRPRDPHPPLLFFRHQRLHHLQPAGHPARAGIREPFPFISSHTSR